MRQTCMALRAAIEEAATIDGLPRRTHTPGRAGSGDDDVERDGVERDVEGRAAEHRGVFTEVAIANQRMDAAEDSKREKLEGACKR